MEAVAAIRVMAVDGLHRASAVDDLRPAVMVAAVGHRMVVDPHMVADRRTAADAAVIANDITGAFREFRKRPKRSLSSQVGRMV